jgi:hypothetical protein
MLSLLAQELEDERHRTFILIDRGTKTLRIGSGQEVKAKTLESRVRTASYIGFRTSAVLGELSKYKYQTTLGN